MMVGKIVFDDGKTVELSKSTTKRLRKELLKPTPPKDFKDGLFRMRVLESYDFVEIDSDYEDSRTSSYVCRGLNDLKEIREQLNLFINYLEEIDNG